MADNKLGEDESLSREVFDEMKDNKPDEEEEVIENLASVASSSYVKIMPKTIVPERSVPEMKTQKATISSSAEIKDGAKKKRKYTKKKSDKEPKAKKSDKEPKMLQVPGASGIVFNDSIGSFIGVTVMNVSAPIQSAPAQSTAIQSPLVPRNVDGVNSQMLLPANQDITHLHEKAAHLASQSHLNSVKAKNNLYTAQKDGNVSKVAAPENSDSTQQQSFIPRAISRYLANQNRNTAQTDHAKPSTSNCNAQLAGPSRDAVLAHPNRNTAQTAQLAGPSRDAVLAQLGEISNIVNLDSVRTDNAQVGQSHATVLENSFKNTQIMSAGSAHTNNELMVRRPENHAFPNHGLANSNIGRDSQPPNTSHQNLRNALQNGSSNDSNSQINPNPLQLMQNKVNKMPRNVADNSVLNGRIPMLIPSGNQNTVPQQAYFLQGHPNAIPPQYRMQPYEHGQPPPYQPGPHPQPGHPHPQSSIPQPGSHSVRHPQSSTQQPGPSSVRQPQSSIQHPHSSRHPYMQSMPPHHYNPAHQTYPHPQQLMNVPREPLNNDKNQHQNQKNLHLQHQNQKNLHPQHQMLMQPPGHSPQNQLPYANKMLKDQHPTSSQSQQLQVPNSQQIPSVVYPHNVSDEQFYSQNQQFLVAEYRHQDILNVEQLERRHWQELEWKRKCDPRAVVNNVRINANQQIPLHQNPQILPSPLNQEQQVERQSGGLRNAELRKENDMQQKRNIQIEPGTISTHREQMVANGSFGQGNPNIMLQNPFDTEGAPLQPRSNKSGVSVLTPDQLNKKSSLDINGSSENLLNRNPQGTTPPLTLHQGVSKSRAPVFTNIGAKRMCYKTPVIQQRMEEKQRIEQARRVTPNSVQHQGNVVQSNQTTENKDSNNKGVLIVNITLILNKSLQPRTLPSKWSLDMLLCV